MDSLLTRPSLRRAGDHWVMVLGQRLAPRPDTVPGRTIEPVVQVTSPAARRLDRVDDPDLSKRYDPFQVPPAGWSEVPLGEWWYGEGAAPR